MEIQEVTDHKTRPLSKDEELYELRIAYDKLREDHRAFRRDVAEALGSIGLVDCQEVYEACQAYRHRTADQDLVSTYHKMLRTIVRRVESLALRGGK